MGLPFRVEKNQLQITIYHVSDKQKQSKITERWPGRQISAYQLEPGTFQISCSDNILCGTFIPEKEMFLKSLELSFSLHSREFRVYGTRTSNSGLSLSHPKGVIHFKRTTPGNQIIKSSRKGKKIYLTWELNRNLKTKDSVILDPLAIKSSNSVLQPEKLRRQKDRPLENLWIFSMEKEGLLNLKKLEENLDWMEKNRIFFHAVRLNHLLDNSGNTDDLPEDIKGKLPAITRRIDRHGMIPILDFSPFLTKPGSELAEKHPDWLVKNLKSGLPVSIQKKRKKRYVLDVTHPGVKRHIQTLIKNIQDKWGFRGLHLKDMDILFTPGIREESSTECGSLMREALSLVKNSTAPPFFIGMEGLPSLKEEELPLMVSLPWNTGTKRYTPREICSHIHKIMEIGFTGSCPWLLNPGPYLLHGEKTGLPLQAAESLRQMLLLQGGVLSFRQELCLLNPAQIDELKQLLTFFTTFSSGELKIISNPDEKRPELLFNTAGYLGIFNLSSKKQRINLNMQELKEILYNKRGTFPIKEGNLDMHTGELELILPPYGSRLFRF